MYCKNCGNQLNEGASVCMNCGFAAGTGTTYCASCGKLLNPGAVICTGCGCSVNYPQPTQANFVKKGGKSKLIAGLLGIFLGGFGIHNFYLGRTGRGVAQIIVTAITFGVGSLWGFIEGILCLTGQYTDAEGNPLSDDLNI